MHNNIRWIAVLICVFFSALLQAQDKSYGSMLITIDKKGVPLPEIMAEIERQSGMSFTYESSVIKNLPPVTLSVKDMPLKECLDQLLLKLPIMYQVTGRFIILKKKPRQVVVNGFIRDKASSEALIGASIYEPISRKGTATNNYGFFSLSLEPGDIALQFSYIGYQTQLISFPFMEKDTLITIELNVQGSLQEIVVLGSENERQPILDTRVGTLDIDHQTIRNTPTMFGESDIVKTLQMTPGVAAGVEGLAGMYVRGGNMDENLFLIDGNPVYQVNHLGGIFSSFNPEAIRNMEFFKAGFPARYGGRLSSVVDVHTKDGNMKEFHGSASLGLISANLNLEGPIIKDKTSFMISFRRTWLDAIMAPTLAIINKRRKEEMTKANGGYAFHDLNMKLNHRFNERSRLYISLYNGLDNLHAKSRDWGPMNDLPYERFDKTNLRWGNLMATAGWTNVFNAKLFGRISGFYTQYRSSMKQRGEYEWGTKGESPYQHYENYAATVTGITDFGFRSSFDYLPSSDHRIRFGGDAILHRFRPEYSEIETFVQDTAALATIYTDELLWAREFGAFLEDDWALNPYFRLNAGLRYSLFNVQGKTYMGLEPRLSFRWLVKKNFSIKGAYSRMNQYVHVLSNSYVNLPTDAWMPVTSKLKPLISDHVTAGVYYNLKNQYDFSLEGYYKHFHNLLEYKDGSSHLSSFTLWEDKLTNGTGRSYGAEFMLRKSAGKTTGWIGYTLSWSDRKFGEIDKGKRFPSRFDNRHKLNIVAMHKITPRIELSAAWTYTSGNRITLSLEDYEGWLIGGNSFNSGIQPVYLDYYEGRNNYKLPDYHRLDLGLSIYRPKKKGRMGIWNISVYNAYCRMNPFMVYKDFMVWCDNYGGDSGYDNPQNGNRAYRTKFKTVSIIPIIPSISYTYKF